MSRPADCLYLDHAAGAWPRSPACLPAIAETIAAASSAGRSAHEHARNGDALLFAVRNAVAQFFNVASPEQVVFTSGTTEGLNTVIRGRVRPGDCVYVSNKSHHAVIRPLLAQNAEVRFFDPQNAESFNPGARMVIFEHASNVDGACNDAAAVVSLAHAAGIPVLLDAAQSAGAIPLDVRRIGADFVALPAHKALKALPGCGVLIFNTELRPLPLRFGGTGSHASFYKSERLILPDSYEAGTPNLPGIAALSGALKAFDSSVFSSAYCAKKTAFLTRLFSLLDGIDGVQIYAAPPERNIGIISLTFSRKSVDKIADELDRDWNIAVRAGLHCALKAHETLGTFDFSKSENEGRGTVRLSFGPLLTASEETRLCEALCAVLQ